MSALTREPRRGWRALGLAGAACVACCTGPLVAAVGGIGAAGSLAAWLLWPTAGGAVAATTVAAVLLLRRRQPAEADGSEPVPVELSARPTTSSPPRTDEQLRAHFHDAEADHDDARRLGVFGSPTLVFGSGDAAFVKLHAPPSGERAAEVFETVRATAGLDTVQEITRPRAPRKPPDAPAD